MTFRGLFHPAKYELSCSFIVLVLSEAVLVFVIEDFVLARLQDDYEYDYAHEHVKAFLGDYSYLRRISQYAPRYPLPIASTSR